MKFGQTTLIFTLLFVMNGLFAQKFQLAGIGYSKNAKSEIKDSPTNQEVELQIFGLFAKLPVKFKNQKTVLLNTFRYGFVQPTTYRSPLFRGVENQLNLHMISLSPMLIQKLSSKWSIIAALTPTLASDFKEKLCGDDLLVLGALLASTKLNDRWTLGGGLVYTNQLGDPRFLPAIQMRYLKERHFVNVLLPSFVNYMYRIDKKEKLRLGIRLATNGGNFNVINSDFTEVIPNTTNKIIYSQVNMGAVVNFQITKSVMLEAFGGMSTARNNKLEDASKKYYEYSSANGAFFNLGIILTAPTKTADNSQIDN